MLRIASIAKINARTKKIEKRARIKYKQAKKKKKKSNIECCLEGNRGVKRKAFVEKTF